MDVEVEETGTTFEENSLLKARAVMEASGLPAIADDSGLCVDALNGAPGVYSARYGGPGLDDPGRVRLLLENMRGQMPRTCRFVSVITCCFPNGDVLSARGECEGTVAFTPMGEGGFGYDPVFFCSHAEKNLCPAYGRGEECHLPPGKGTGGISGEAEGVSGEKLTPGPKWEPSGAGPIWRGRATE